MLILEKENLTEVSSLALSEEDYVYGITFVPNYIAYSTTSSLYLADSETFE